MSRLDDETLTKLINKSKDNDLESFDSIINSFRPLINSLIYKFSKMGLDKTEIKNEAESALARAILDYDQELDPSPIRHLSCRARYGIWNLYAKSMNYFKYPKPLMFGDFTQLRKKININNSDVRNENWEDDVLDALELKRAIEILPVNQKRIIQLYFYDDMTQSEIAEQLGCWQTAVSWNILSAIKQLKKILV